jgi:hypothetical protein
LAPKIDHFRNIAEMSESDSMSDDSEFQNSPKELLRQHFEAQTKNTKPLFLTRIQEIDDDEDSQNQNQSPDFGNR